MEYKIFYVDVDPDGDRDDRVVVVALVKTEEYAITITNFLNKEDQEPNPYTYEKIIK